MHDEMKPVQKWAIGVDPKKEDDPYSTELVSWVGGPPMIFTTKKIATGHMREYYNKIKNRRPRIIRVEIRMAEE